MTNNYLPAPSSLLKTHSNCFWHDESGGDLFDSLDVEINIQNPGPNGKRSILVLCKKCGGIVMERD